LRRLFIALSSPIGSAFEFAAQIYWIALGAGMWALCTEAHRVLPILYDLQVNSLAGSAHRHADKKFRVQTLTNYFIRIFLGIGATR
jgi:hypothetical protein